MWKISRHRYETLPPSCRKNENVLYDRQENCLTDRRLVWRIEKLSDRQETVWQIGNLSNKRLVGQKKQACLSERDLFDRLVWQRGRLAWETEACVSEGYLVVRPVWQRETCERRGRLVWQAGNLYDRFVWQRKTCLTEGDSWGRNLWGTEGLVGERGSGGKRDLWGREGDSCHRGRPVRETGNLYDRFVWQTETSHVAGRRSRRCRLQDPSVSELARVGAEV